MNNPEALQKIIVEAKQNADIVVVIFHGGGEGIKYSHTQNNTEWYLKENRGNVRDFAHSSIDMGADIVFGSGPHVLRGIEEYKNKFIAYSLGNFSSANIFSTNSSPKTSAMIEVAFNKDGSLVSGIIYPLEIDKFGIPHLDLNNTGISIINDLSKEDFGKQGVFLNDFGSIILR